MIVCTGNHTHMIKTDGSLWHGSSIMLSDLEQKGWRQIVNPKRTYYPEFDTLHPSYSNKNDIALSEDQGKLIVEVL